MESVKSPIMHATDTKSICSTLPCDENEGNEISKNLEDELLYGANEDGDEDDAQSDDSLRLRLSDDDVDVDDIGVSSPTNQLKQSENTEPLDMEFDVHTSNYCSVQHQDNSSGACSIASEHSGIKMELDFTNDLMENNFSDTDAENPFERGTSQFPELNALKYTYGSRRKLSGSFKANQSFSVNRSYPDHSYNSIISNRYGNRYYNQSSHYGRLRGYKFGEFNTYFNSFGLERKYSLRVYPPSRKVLSENQYITAGSNSQTNVSANENTSHKDNSSAGISDTQHKISNDIDIKSIVTDNNSPQLIGSELPTDKMNTSLNSSKKISLSVNSKHEPKVNGIVGEDNDIGTTCDTNASMNSKDKDSTAKLVPKSDAEPSIVPIKIKTEVDDVSESTNVKDAEASCDNSNHKEIKDAGSSISNTVLTAPIDNPPNDATITNKEKPAGSIQAKIINSDKETMIKRKDCSEIILDNDAVIDGKNVDDNSESPSVPNCNESDADNGNNKGDQKMATKRPLNISGNDNSVCEKKSCLEINVNEPTSKDEVEISQVPSTDAPSNTEDCLELQSSSGNKNVTHKLGNESAKLNKLNNKSESSVEKTTILPIEILDDDENLDKDDDKLEITAVIPSTEMSNKGKRRRRKRKTNPAGDVANSCQEKENVRQKRETAQKAEELIRKRFQKNDSDSESSDNVQTFVSYNKPNPRGRPSSPPSLKRNCPDEVIENNVVKKVKNEVDTHVPSKTTETVKSSNNSKTLEQVRKFFWRDGKKSLSKFTQEELEELLIQKVIETITMRDEIGKLREQAKISERNQEATRLKCQQLTKQIKDFEMVLNRFSADRRGGDKNIPPIKINRSVGLQVNFVTDNGVQNLRQLQHIAKSNATTVNGGNAPTNQPNELPNNNTTVRKGIKVRSPRRTSDVPPVSPAVSVTSTDIQVPVTSTATPAVLVVPKSTDNRPVINSPSQVVAQQGSITLNGAVTTTSRQSKVLNTRSNNSNSDNLIDLTGEEEKSKNVVNPPPLAAITTSSAPAIIPKAPPRYQRVIQPTPPNVTINQPAFKIVQPVDKPMPTAIVNNMNASRLAFVMHGIGGPRQVMLAPNTNGMRPVIAANNRGSFTGITYTGVGTIPNGSVRVLPATTTAPPQKNKHPAPLPGITTYPINAALKLPPPAPSLKISKVANGIVLSWNMRNSDEYAEIASYQLYAYQEVTGVAPSTALWKKVGDVRALPLPMACTLTQFSEGNNYYFAVRGVDTHSRLGQYSQPGNISL